FDTTSAPPSSRVSDVVTLNARYADLAIVGQRDAERHDPGTAPELPEHVVLDVGRPVLILPHAGHFPTVGERVSSIAGEVVGGTDGGFCDACFTGNYPAPLTDLEKGLVVAASCD
ncbi:MAG: hypothetical protein ACE5NA_10620, partial [Nitrospiraceae bacterium]